MAKVTVTDSNLTAIGQAIREKRNVETMYKPSEMPAAIRAIHTEPNLDQLTVTQNGTYEPQAGVDGFDEVSVNVPNSYTQADEGKVVSSGALVAQTSKTVTQNGTVDTTLNDEVIVDVPSGAPNLQDKTITQNGVYTADAGYDGLGEVTVNVSGGGVAPGLPSSIQANILSSAYMGNFVDTSTPWDGFVFHNGASAFTSQNYMYLASDSYVEYDLGASKSVTIYFVGASTDNSNNYPTLFGLIYAASNGNIAVVNSYNGVAHFSRFGSELSGMPTINTRKEHCWAIAVNAEAKTAKLYADGQYIGVLTLNNAGQYIRVATVTNTQYQGNILVDYIGVVEGEEAAETIVANQQSLMTVFGISGE